MKNCILGFVSISTIMICNACTKNKLQGNLKTTGIVVDAYNQQPIVGAILQMTSCRSGGLMSGGTSRREIGTVDTTDVNGYFEVIDTGSKSSQKFIMIKGKVSSNKMISNLYQIADWKIANNANQLMDKEWMELQFFENTTLDLKVELQRFSWLHLQVKHNINVIADTLTFKANAENRFIIKKDTTVFAAIAPNQASRIIFNKNRKEIKEFTINTGLKGDTILQTIVL